MKKSCSPLLACSSVRLWVLVGSCPGEPHAVAVNMRDALLTNTLDAMLLLPDTGRSGVDAGGVEKAGGGDGEACR